MDIRLAFPSEVNQIMEIIGDARRHIAGYGSDQWQGAYPDREIIVEDILQGYGQVAVVDGRVAAYVAMMGHELAYDCLLTGSWRQPDKTDYLTFHRIAVAEAFRGQGVILALLEGLMEVRQTKTFRADTHPANKAMQHIFTKLGFQQVGIAQLPDGERLAYEKVASEKG
ncbi:MULTISPECIES: N-acetyltransferase family protein [unclassified Streptococcus]|uniref:GNAT family N-acetyltransferase n=1 Tax=unclassified Streptococcus TaxID=2608887 RepID=UPI00359DC268